MKNHRDGPKFGGDHSTFNDTAIVMVDIAARMPEVATISAGYIKSDLKSRGGPPRVKFTWIQGGLLMTVRHVRSTQEVRVYTSDTQTTMVALARAARDRGIPIAFTKKEKTLPSQ